MEYHLIVIGLKKPTQATLWNHRKEGAVVIVGSDYEPWGKDWTFLEHMPLESVIYGEVCYVPDIYGKLLYRDAQWHVLPKGRA